MTSKHDETAKRIAKQVGTDYNRGKGADVKGAKQVVEVETEGTVKDGMRQLQGYNKPVYIAGADAKAVKKALGATKGTTVGVKNSRGKVVKPSTRKRK